MYHNCVCWYQDSLNQNLVPKLQFPLLFLVLRSITGGKCILWLPGTLSFREDPNCIGVCFRDFPGTMPVAVPIHSLRTIRMAERLDSCQLVLYSLHYSYFSLFSHHYWVLKNALQFLSYFTPPSRVPCGIVFSEQIWTSRTVYEAQRWCCSTQRDELEDCPKQGLRVELPWSSLATCLQLLL